MAWFSRNHTEEVLEPPKTYKPAVTPNLNQYESLASEIGLEVPHVLNEHFKLFLIEQDIPVFNLSEVVKYMDAKSRKQKANYGWEWKPLRYDDGGVNSFGKDSYTKSDFYLKRSGNIYDKVVPYHALKKVALIDKRFKGQIRMFVSDYAPKPTIAKVPDPFLMAVVPLSTLRLEAGEGRYVIDFWDEPGFGLEAQLR